MCHHAEIEFSMAVIGTLSMLIIPAPNRITPYVKRIQRIVFG